MPKKEEGGERVESPLSTLSFPPQHASLKRLQTVSLFPRWLAKSVRPAQSWGLGSDWSICASLKGTENYGEYVAFVLGFFVCP